jgi:hypothetical protein
MKTSQYERIGKLLTRKTGATAMDIASVAGTVSPHSRLAEMKRAGWRIWREAIAGRAYGRYFGKGPGAA